MTDQSANMLEQKKRWRFTISQLFYFLILCVILTPIGVAAVQGKPWGVSIVIGFCAFVCLIGVNIVFYFVIRAVSLVIGR